MRVEFQSQAINFMERLCRDAVGILTGGVLIGTYSADLQNIIVTEVTGPPPDSKAEHGAFTCGFDGLAELLLNRWDADPRTFFLGYWHSRNVDSLAPSELDSSTMASVADNPDYQSKSPVLVICKTGKAAETMDASRAPEDSQTGTGAFLFDCYVFDSQLSLLSPAEIVVAWQGV